MRRATTQKSTGEFFYVALECIDGFIQREVHFVLLFAVYYSKRDRLSDWLLRRRVHCTQQASSTTHLAPLEGAATWRIIQHDPTAIVCRP